MLYDISSEDIVSMKIPELMKNTDLVNVRFTNDS